jgi:hypothetical protein
MKRDDIKPGGVYAYTEARPTHPLRAWYRPYLVLSDRSYTYEERQPMQDATGRLVLAPPGARMGRPQRHWDEPVGLPAVEIEEGPGYEDAVAELTERIPELLAAFRHNGTVTGGSGRTLGRYMLITSLGYLHGEFAVMMARKAELKEQEDAAQRARDAEDAKRLAAYQDLARRMSALGLVVDVHPVYRDVPKVITLTFEDAEVLVNLAEYARQESRS